MTPFGPPWSAAVASAAGHPGELGSVGVDQRSMVSIVQTPPIESVQLGALRARAAIESDSFPF